MAAQKPDSDGLSHAERDVLADAIRGEWSGGRHRNTAWDDLSLDHKDRWRAEVDLLPFERLVAKREARAAHFAMWQFFLRLPSPTPLSDAVQREAMRLRDLIEEADDA